MFLASLFVQHCSSSLTVQWGKFFFHRTLTQMAACHIKALLTAIKRLNLQPNFLRIMVKPNLYLKLNCGWLDWMRVFDVKRPRVCLSGEATQNKDSTPLLQWHKGQTEWRYKCTKRHQELMAKVESVIGRWLSSLLCFLWVFLGETETYCFQLVPSCGHHVSITPLGDTFQSGANIHWTERQT